MWEQIGIAVLVAAILAAGRLIFVPRRRQMAAKNALEMATKYEELIAARKKNHDAGCSRVGKLDKLINQTYVRAMLVEMRTTDVYPVKSSGRFMVVAFFCIATFLLLVMLSFVALQAANVHGLIRWLAFLFILATSFIYPILIFKWEKETDAFEKVDRAWAKAISDEFIQICPKEDAGSSESEDQGNAD